VKSDPDAYGWDALVKQGGTRWDGVRNAEARNSLAEIKAERSLAKLKLVTHSRLSVMPIDAAAFERIRTLAQTPPKR